MVRNRFKKVLLVAPKVFPVQLLTEYRNVKHIELVSAIFPSLFELKPDLIIFDYDYVGEDIEKVLRRIMLNKFYDKLKICCCKNTEEPKTDAFLRMIGVDSFVYKEDLIKAEKSKNILGSIGNILDASVLKWVGSIAN